MKLNQIAQKKLNQAKGSDFSTTSHLKTKHISSKLQALIQLVTKEEISEFADITT